MSKYFLKKGRLIILLSLVLVLFSVSQVYAAPLNVTIGVGTPVTDTIGTGASTENGAMILLEIGASVQLTDKPFISISDQGMINLNGNASVNVVNTNFSNMGLYGSGPSAIEMQSRNNLTLEAGSKITFFNIMGTEGAAIRLIGSGNAVENKGTIETVTGGTAISSNGSQNVIVNYGSITGSGIAAILFESVSDQIINAGVITGDIISNSGQTTLNNLINGNISGNISFNGGNNSIILDANSIRPRSISGDISGTGDNNLLILHSEPNQSETFDNTITGFQILNKTGQGEWIVGGNIGYFDEINVEQGTLILTGTNADFNGAITIGNNTGEAVFESSTDSLAFASLEDTSITVNQDGILRFNQSIPLKTVILDNFHQLVKYEGTITGDGMVEKIGAGSLVLNIGQTYSGGTWIKDGEIAIYSNGSHEDSALGALSSKVILGDENTSGTLTFLNSVYINSERDIEIKAGGGILNTRGILEYDDITQAHIEDPSVPGGKRYLGASADIYSVISGTGNLTKKGKGGLAFHNANTYTGHTYIEEGILLVHKGFVSPEVHISDESKDDQGDDTGYYKGEIAFYTEGFVYDGKIDGAGRISVQDGDITLTNYNDFHGLVEVFGTMTLAGANSYLSAETWFIVGVVESDNPSEAPKVGKLYIKGDQDLPVIKLYEDAVFILDGELHVDHDNLDGYNLDASFHEDSFFMGEGSMYFESGRTILERSSFAFEGTAQVFDGAFLQLKSGDRTAILNGTTTIDFGGTVEGDGSLGIIENYGIVSPGTDGTFGTISALDNYIGHDNSVLVIDAELGDDNSLTDKLRVVFGDSSGHTLIKVNNRGGLGNKTEDGILVVEVIYGDSDAVFELSSNYIDPISGKVAVLGGYYAYHLEKDGTNWYLRSLLQPNVPVYEVYPQLLFGMNGLSTLQQRVGNRRWMLDEDLSYMEKAGQWVKFDSSFGRFQSHLSADTNYDMGTFRVQSGIDRPLFKLDESSWLIGGVSAFYSKGKSNVGAYAELGTINSDGFGLAGSLTLYHLKGFYMDIQAQAMLYLSDLYVEIKNNPDPIYDMVYVNEENNRGTGSALGIEMGYKIDLNANWSLTPQLQLTSSRVNFEPFVDEVDKYVMLIEAKSLIGRLSLSADYEKNWIKGINNVNHLHAYGILNIYNEFSDGAVIYIGEDIISEQNKLWGGLGVGATYSLKDGFTSVYGEVSVNTSLKDFWQNRVFSAVVGFRIKF